MSGPTLTLPPVHSFKSIDNSRFTFKVSDYDSRRRFESGAQRGEIDITVGNQPPVSSSSSYYSSFSTPQSEPALSGRGRFDEDVQVRATETWGAESVDESDADNASTLLASTRSPSPMGSDASCGAYFAYQAKAARLRMPSESDDDKYSRVAAALILGANLEITDGDSRSDSRPSHSFSSTFKRHAVAPGLALDSAIDSVKRSPPSQRRVDFGFIAIVMAIGVAKILGAPLITLALLGFATALLVQAMRNMSLGINLHA